MFSHTVGREGHCRQMSLACVGGTRSVRPHRVCPAHGACATLLRPQAALQGVGPELHAVPVLGYSTKAQTRLGLRFVPSPARAAQAARSLMGTLFPGAVHLIPSAVPASVSTHAGWVRLVCSGEVVSSCDPPSGCQPSRISGSLWLETGSLFAVW